MKKLSLLASVFAIMLLSACESNSYKSLRVENPSTQAEKDQNAIIDYLVANKINNAKKTESGIFYTISKEGTGVNPSAESYVEVHYKGTLLDGTQFDSSYDRGETATFPLTQVIKGWTEGIPLLKKGGKGTLYIPSGLAYGANPRPGGVIKPNSPLVFDVELVEVLTKKEYDTKQTEMILNMVEKTTKAGRDKLGEKEDAEIQKFIKKKGWKATKTDNGIYVVMDKEGNGEHPAVTDNVQVHYAGKLLNGKGFDSSYDRGEPITFPLTRVIPGWMLGIPKFSKGGKGKLIIPSYLAYGERGAGDNIPANSILVFDVELLDIVK